MYPPELMKKIGMPAMTVETWRAFLGQFGISGGMRSYPHRTVPCPVLLNDEKSLVRVTEGWSPLNYPNLTLFLTIAARPNLRFKLHAFAN